MSSSARRCASSSAERADVPAHGLVAGPAALIVVVSGPGGVGKGTIVDGLVARDPRLWLSRSWTSRAQREGEPDDAYVFVSRDDFERRLAAGGFLEWTEFLGNYYGTPIPDVPSERDLLLEIELEGARQVKRSGQDVVLIFVLPPSREEQHRRLVGRGDEPGRIAERLRKAEEEEVTGLDVADHVVVNDELEHTIDQLLGVLALERSKRVGADQP